MTKQKEIPKEILEIISYLSNQFAYSMHSTVDSKEDLYNDLVVLYLSDVNKIKVTLRSHKNFWFIKFKNFLLNKYKHIQIEKKNILPELEQIDNEEE